LCMLMIIILGYTQIGCQSTDNTKYENNKVNEEISDSKGNNNSNDEKDAENQNNVSIMDSSDAQIHFINTGNSDATLIIKDGKAALIDAGDNDDEKLVVNYIKKQGINELEYVFATHLHADHIGGLDAVTDEIKIKNLYVSNGDSETKTYRDFIKAASNKGLKPSVPLLNSEFKLGSSVFKVLSVANTDDPNNNSIVLLYTNGNDKILLMGDAEAQIEKNINPGKVDLLKVGHHGSHSSSTSSFIEKINPKYASILVGKDNKYGHPHKETMQLLEKKDIEVHRSDECGDIIFTSTGNGLNINCKKGSYNNGNSKKSKSSEDKVVTQQTNVSSSSDEYNSNEDNSVSEGNASQVDLVYWSSTGKKYHSNPECSGMKSPISGSISESGRSACSKCY
ncbi:MAG: ComEC/Rec2 family competence protein, partial [Romboutsia sp.]|uniref:ComEC/Rec2 family competence protein n=1 Tax=Romboutsia sp. TaxID=1965302 RepID=UPI003F37CD1B